MDEQPTVISQTKGTNVDKILLRITYENNLGIIRMGFP